MMRIFTGYFLFLVGVLSSAECFSQIGLYYRTRGGQNGNGDWNNLNIWEVSSTGTGNYSTPAPAPPDETSYSILIRNGNAVTVTTTGTTARRLSLNNNNSALTIASGASLRVVDEGTGNVDLSVSTNCTVNVAGELIIGSNSSYSHNGILLVTGTVSNHGVINNTTVSNANFQSGGRYRHLRTTNGSIPLATWNANSTMEVAGYTGSVTANPAGNWGQPFGHVEVNLTNLSGGATMNFAGWMNNIAGNLLITNTGAGQVILINGSPTTVNVGGNFITQPGTLTNITNNGSSSTLAVVGNVVNNGTLRLANGNGSSALSVGGSFTNTNPGTFTISTGNGSPTVTVNGTFANSGTFTKTTGTGSPNLIVRSDVTNSGTFVPGNGGTVFFDGLSIVTGSPNFYHVQLNAARSLIIPSGDVGVAGHLNFDPTCSFTQNGGIVFNGSIDQNINNNGIDFNIIRVNKSSGALNFNHTLALFRLLDIQSATTLNTNNNLTIKSLGNTTDLDASIGPVAEGAVINGDVTVERFVDPIGVTYRYMASPVSGKLPPAEWGSSIYEYRYVSGTGGWVKRGSSSTLSLGTGYAVLVPNGVDEVTWAVTGPVHTGDYTWNFTNQGWHLLGNPFPSAIRWYNDPLAWELDNIATTIAVTDNSVSGYPNYFRYWSYDPDDDPDSWGTGPLENGVVATGQGFWIYVGEGGGSLTLKEPSKSIDGDGEFYRKRNNPSIEKLVVSLNNGTYADKAMLKLNPDAPEKFNMHFGTIKLRNEDMNIFFLDKEQNELLVYTRKQLHEEENLPLGIQVKQPGTYTISFTNVEHFTSGSTLYLIDRQEQQAVPVNGSGYQFVISNAAKPITDRFYLSFNPSIPEQNLNDLVKVFPNPVTDRLVIQLPENQPANIRLLDAKGSVMVAKPIQGEHILDATAWKPGMYLLQVITPEGAVVKKVVK